MKCALLGEHTLRRLLHVAPSIVTCFYGVGTWLVKREFSVHHVALCDSSFQMSFEVLSEYCFQEFPLL